MKRFSKIFSGIAAVMLGVGIILTAVGFGSVKSDWKEIVEAAQGNGWVEQEFDNVKSIELKVPFGYVAVGTAKDGKVHFQAANVEADALKIRQTGGELEIRMDGKREGLRNLSIFLLMAVDRGYTDEKLAQPEYQLLLPADYTGELDIDLDVGKVWVSGADAAEMDISIEVGELAMEECRAGKLDAECDIGSCTVEGMFRDISVKSDVGVLYVNLYGFYEDYDGVIACEVGEMEYHMGVDSVSGWADHHYTDGILRVEGWEEEDDPLVEAWNRKEGIDLRKKWVSPTAKGELKVKCDIGEVFVVFTGATVFEREK